jgi:hypothetical protein
MYIGIVDYPGLENMGVPSPEGAQKSVLIISISYLTYFILLLLYLYFKVYI